MIVNEHQFAPSGAAIFRSIVATKFRSDGHNSFTINFFQSKKEVVEGPSGGGGAVFVNHPAGTGSVINRRAVAEPCFEALKKFEDVAEVLPERGAVELVKRATVIFGLDDFEQVQNLVSEGNQCVGNFHSIW